MRSFVLSLIILSIPVGAVGQSTGAQEPVVPEVYWTEFIGDSVRILGLPDTPTGRLVEARGDTLVLERDPTGSRIPLILERGSTLERWDRRSSAAAFAVGFGVVGLVTGLFVGRSQMEDEQNFQIGPLLAPVAFGAAGALVGLGVGQATGSEGWEEAVPARASREDPASVELYVRLPVPRWR